ncbi:hypothetical protein LTR85_007889 [Meristemomyces frigidus]|nr:hypothetical protein LTR85_007889 [Meristemomyces frigidus]
MVDAAPNPTYSTALGVSAQTVTYNPTTIVQAATADITSVTVEVTDVATSTPGGVEKRSVTTAATSGCSTAAAQATGAGPVPSPDTASAFLAYPSFSAVASAAPTPPGYTNTFTNQQASNNAYGYLGYTTLKTYDTVTCASKCNAINGCMGINIYYERDPSVTPGTGCDDPPSTTNIKCVFWGGEVTADSLNNLGQYRDQFQVVMAGSNGYMNTTLVPLTGYTEPTYLGNAAINAPYDAQGYNSYMGSTIFSVGPFNASLCADYCTAQNLYNLAHPPSDGSPVQTCQFFNTYILYVNTTKNLQGQYCAIYSETWSSSYATNVGQYRGNDHYLIEYSYTYSNKTNPGTACKSCAIAQATQEISWSSEQPFCSTLLGVSAATSTATAPQTVTPVTTVTVASTTKVISVIAKRSVAQSTPPNLTKYPASVISSACSLVISSTTTVVTVSPTITASPSIVTVAVGPATTQTTTVSAISCGTYPTCDAEHPCPNQAIGSDPCTCFQLTNGGSACFDLFSSQGAKCNVDSDCSPGDACFHTCAGKTCQTVKNQCANQSAPSRLFVRKLRAAAEDNVKRDDDTSASSVLTTIDGTTYMSTSTAFAMVPLPTSD